MFEESCLESSADKSTSDKAVAYRDVVLIFGSGYQTLSSHFVHGKQHIFVHLQHI